VYNATISSQYNITKTFLFYRLYKEIPPTKEHEHKSKKHGKEKEKDKKKKKKEKKKKKDKKKKRGDSISSAEDEEPPEPTATWYLFWLMLLQTRIFQKSKDHNFFQIRVTFGPLKYYF
jgi:outer membrane biosynthesis protein TonB